MQLLEEIAAGRVDTRSRTELIAPLDNLIWDRKLIEKLFGFSYTWEIYTPANKRVYSAYALPILMGEQFIGRIEVVADRASKSLLVKNLWLEQGIKETRKLHSDLHRCLKRFATFNECVLQDYNPS